MIDPHQKHSSPAIARMDAILTCLQATAEGLPLSELSRRTAIAKSTCLRIVRQLAEGSYLRFDADSNRYSLGVRLVALGQSAARGFDWLTVVRQEAAHLSERLQLPVKVSTIFNGTVTLIEKTNPPQAMHLSVRTGAVFPLHAGAASKVLLGMLPDDDIEALLQSPLERFTPATICNRDDLLQAVAAVRQKGFAIDAGEFVEGIMAVAVPLRLPEANASLSVPFVKGSDESHHIDRLVDELQNARSRIERELQHLDSPR